MQIVQLTEQLYVWVGAGDRPVHGELSMAVKTRMSDTPSVTTLLAPSAAAGSGDAAASAGGAMAMMVRLARYPAQGLTRVHCSAQRRRFR